MQALYDRMAASVASIASPRDNALAMAIVNTVLCAFRILKLDELADALPEDTSEVLDLERSIVELCGGLVTVDSGGNVAMVHQNAREYLLASTSVPIPFKVQRGDGHTQLFESCMRCLTSKGLRARVARGDEPAFLDYATSQWASHLSSIPRDCAQVHATIRRFFTEPWVLTWIHVVATKGQLRLLIQASRILSNIHECLPNYSKTESPRLKTANSCFKESCSQLGS